MRSSNDCDETEEIYSPVSCYEHDSREAGWLEERIL